MASRPTYLGVKNGVPEATVALVIATAAATCKRSVTGLRPSLQSCPKPRRARQCCRLVNWLTPRVVAKRASRNGVRERSANGAIGWGLHHPTRPGLHRPWSSGFTPALFVGAYSRFSLSSSRVERCVLQMVSIRAPVSDAGCDGHRMALWKECVHNAQPQMELQCIDEINLNARCSQPLKSGRPHAGSVLSACYRRCHGGTGAGGHLERTDAAAVRERHATASRRPAPRPHICPSISRMAAASRADRSG